MGNYNNLKVASRSYHMGLAVCSIQQDTDTLGHWARKTAPLVYSGALDFFEAWDALWFAAVTSGVEHLVAQRIIGVAFASAKQGVEVTA